VCFFPFLTFHIFSISLHSFLVYIFPEKSSVIAVFFSSSSKMLYLLLLWRFILSLIFYGLNAMCLDRGFFLIIISIFQASWICCLIWFWQIINQFFFYSLLCLFSLWKSHYACISHFSFFHSSLMFSSILFQAFFFDFSFASLYTHYICSDSFFNHIKLTKEFSKYLLHLYSVFDF
jgi:hypothetical protein